MGDVEIYSSDGEIGEGHDIDDSLEASGVGLFQILLCANICVW